HQAQLPPTSPVHSNKPNSQKTAAPPYPDTTAVAFHRLSPKQSKTLFALFVYKSIIRFVRVPDLLVNKTRQHLKALLPTFVTGAGNNNKTLEEYSLWKAANPKPQRWISHPHAVAGWNACSNCACMAPQ
ncbi:hypothetical protein, partial [Pseudomonas sp. PS01298]|uniref:hypothetical protein n=1 Tax=Pseudomonas sp. PS01298 TaxID=2991434 RepID=UPI00249BB1D2